MRSMLAYVLDGLGRARSALTTLFDLVGSGGGSLVAALFDWGGIKKRAPGWEPSLGL